MQHLSDHTDDLRAQNAALQQRLDALLAENTTLQAQANALLAELATYKETARLPNEQAASLLSADQFLAAILEQLPVGVSIAEAPSGKLLFHNAEAVRLLRHPLLPSADYTGYDQYGALHTDGRPYTPAEYPIARALLSEAAVPFEDMRYRRGDGSLTIFAVNATPIHDEQGQLIAVVSTFHDVKAQRELEQALRESEARFAAAFQGSPIALVISTAADGRIIDANERFLRLFGRTRDDVIGQASTAIGMWDDPGERKEAIDLLREAGHIRDYEVVIRAAGDERRHVLLSVETLQIADTACMLTALYDISDRVRARAELQERELRLRSVIEHAGIPIWSINADYRLTMANAAFVEGEKIYSGRTPQLGQVMPPDWVQEPARTNLANFYKRALSGESVQDEWARATLAGELRYREYTFNPMVDPAGEVLGVTCFARDITARKTQEEQLRLSEERFRLFIAQTPAAVAMLDRELRYLAASQRWKDDHGITEELLGRSHYEVFPEVPERWKAIHQRCLAGAVERAEEDSFERLDGSCDWLTWEVRPWYDSTGAIGGIVIFSENVTARKQAEVARQRSETLYRAIMHSLPDAAVFVVDRELRYLIAEGPLVAQLGLSRERLEGRTPREALDPKTAATAEAYFTQALAGEELTQEYPYAEHVLWTHYTPLRNDDGQIWAALALVLDITQRKRLEEQFRQAQKMESIGQLAGGIAHDFNNLLTAIGGYADLAQSSLAPEAAVHADLQEIQRAADRAAALTRQLLAFARRQRMELRSLNLNSLVQNLEKLLRRLIGEHIELDVELAADLYEIVADPGQLEQVLVNLAINARDAMPDGGTLTITTANVVLDPRYAHGHVDLPAGSYVLLAVSDTGMGIPPEIQPHLFEPFFTTKPVGQGTGLGLATCYGIVKQHGGTIWVYSEVGHGTVIKVYLPRALAQVAQQQQPDTPAALPQGSETVLIAEDERAVRAFAARVLRACGYTVLEAADGEEALQLARAHAPEPIHLLLSDVVMPHLSGPAAAAQIHALYPALRVLFMSGYTGLSTNQYSNTTLDTPLLQKPFAALALASAVRAALDV